VAAQGPGTGYRVLVGGGGLVLLVAGIKAAAPILQPTVLALFLALLSASLVQRLERPYWPGHAGLPHWLAVLLTLALLAFGVVLCGFLLEQSIARLVAQAPAYSSRLSELASQVEAFAVRIGVPVPEEPVAGMLTGERALGILRGTAVSAAGLLFDLLLVLFMLLFLLLEFPLLSARMEAAFGHSAQVSERLQSATAQIQTYVWVKTVVSLADGILFGVGLALLHVDFALLWGFLTFVLRYIPNIGAVIAAIPPAVLALLQYGPGTALFVLGGHFVIDQFLGQIVEPRLTAHSLGLSPAFVLFAVLFWGWVWGAVGVVLAVPLTVTLKILLENTDDLRWLGVLMESSSHRAVRKAAGARSTEAR
jgi:AI-2 transport protein TqsA